MSILDLYHVLTKPYQLSKIEKKNFGEVLKDCDLFKEKDRRIAGRYLDQWIDCFYRLEGKLEKGGSVIDSDDFDFLYMIGESVGYLNDYSSLLVSSFIKYMDDNDEKDFDDYDEKNEKSDKYRFCQMFINYLRFFNNLTASKVKYFFFRETPVRSGNFPLLEIDKELAFAGFNLVDLLAENKIYIKDLKIAVAKYCYLQGLMYSFVFAKNAGVGVFLRFSYDKDKFLRVSDKIKRLKNKYLSEEENKYHVGFKYFFAKLGCLVISEYGASKKVYDGFDIIKKPMCYSAFYSKVLDESVEVEPFTYRLMDVMWKINGMLLIKDKHVFGEDCSDFSSNIITQISNYIDNYLKAIELMYQEGNVDYLKLFDVESVLFTDSGIYKNIFKEKPVDKIRIDFDLIRSEVDKYEGLKKIVLLNDDSKISDVDKWINKIKYSKESDLKLDVLIEKLERDELRNLLACYVKMICVYNNDIEEGSKEIVGFYRAGVFLAHIVNLMLNISKDVWLFNTRPYVVTHPIHKEDKGSKSTDIILIDDNIKTGYTYKLYDSYLKRNHYGFNVNICLYSLFDFSKYKRMQGVNLGNIKSLATVNGKKVTGINDFLESSKIKKVEYEIKDINLKDVLSCVSEDGYVDMSYVLSNTDIFMSICYNFAENIKDYVGTDSDKRIALYSPSVNAEVLSLMIAYLLKVEYEKDVVFVRQGYSKSNSNECLVGIDVSFMSGFSFSYNWGIINKGFYNYEKVESIEQFIPNEIDLVLVVYNGSDLCSNKIKSIV